MNGIIFDVKEFALNDGDGIRTTVFFKGCPLRCIWCHNPEGLSPSPELYLKRNGCRNCGLCKKPCSHEECQPFGRCTKICPMDLVKIAGERYEVNALASKLLKSSEIFKSANGGITYSGGEPLMQADFLFALTEKLKGKVHQAIETSGYCNQNVFRKVAKNLDFVIMDIKLADTDLHKQHTGAGNEKILANFKILKDSGKPYIIRTPLIPNITDTTENLEQISKIIGNNKWEKLPYNAAAAAKYKMLGLKYFM
jgi:pyruvate formate lyase activating enzyme